MTVNNFRRFGVPTDAIVKVKWLTNAKYKSH